MYTVHAIVTAALRRVCKPDGEGSVHVCVRFASRKMMSMMVEGFRELTCL